MKQFNSIEEMQPYFNEKTKTYEFIENGEVLDIEITFDLTINGDIIANDIRAWNINSCNIDAGNIDVCDIKARDIKASDIKARDISAWSINAGNITAGNITAGDISAWGIDASVISFHAVCYAYKNIVCKSIKGRHENSRYFSLDGEVIIKEDK